MQGIITFVNQGPIFIAVAVFAAIIIVYKLITTSIKIAYIAKLKKIRDKDIENLKKVDEKIANLKDDIRTLKDFRSIVTSAHNEWEKAGSKEQE